jgi:prevent-host-death family protein
MKRMRFSNRVGRRSLAERFPGQRIIPAGEFKPACLRLMDEVRDTGVEIVITKHNRAVARLVPPGDELRPFIGRSRGVIQISREDLMAPIDEDWEVDADL